MNCIGLDAGSVSIKLSVLSENGKRLCSVYRRHRGQPVAVALHLLQELSGGEAQWLHPLKPDTDASFFASPPSLSVTGSAGRIIASVLGLEPVNEVVAHTYATRRLYPGIRTIIELGGEDSKLILLGEHSDSAMDFSMNSVCAAGTGSFLDQQAERLRLSIEEFSALSLKSKNPPRIAGRCSVFAKSDMIHLQQIATPVEDIVAGLCFAVARNFKGSIARGREIQTPVSFQGGVAANAGMVRAFKEVLCVDELFVPDEHLLMGAIGAALKDLDSGRRQPFDLKRLEDFITSARRGGKGHAPLLGDGDRFFERHLKDSEGSGGRRKESQGEENDIPSRSPRLTPPSSRIRAYLGIDIGSISTNLAVIDEDCRLLAKRYLMTAGRPIEAVKQGLEEIGGEIGESVQIAGVGTTGSGRYMIADYVGADIVKNEITAQATAAAFIDKEVDTIFEIGGQDSKYISLRDGVIVGFEMNKACAAGTGSFLEEQAEKLSVPIKREFQKLALKAENPCRLGERCTVFMENSLMTNLQRGAEREDLLAGLAYSIVQNYINRVVGKRPIGRKIFFQGGVAFNKSVVAAFEKYLGKEITVPPNHDVTGAIGMALIAREHMKGREEERREETQARRGEPMPEPASLLSPHSSRRTGFKGFALSKRPYEISSFECKGCPNVCEINRVKIEGEKGYLFYGGRCEKYDIRKGRKVNDLPDLFALREDLLWKAHTERQADRGRVNPLAQSRPVIGIPYVFYFHDFLPFWAALLWELGFEVEVSGKTDRTIVDLGLESVLSETCFPVKTAHGHIRHLVDKGVKTIFMPSFVNLNLPKDAFDTGYACPYTQAIPYSARIAFRKAQILTPVIDMSRGDDYLRKELRKVFSAFGIKAPQISRALAAGKMAQEAFVREIRHAGEEVIGGMKERAVVIIGRAYNSFDRGMNLDIPRKLADLGVQPIPMDFLPLESSDIGRDWPNMYWRAGQRILSAARIVRDNPLLHAVYIGNFSCGPDSFITKFFEEELAEKPCLYLEIDAHSADAGAVTRCEAFLDSVENRSRYGMPSGSPDLGPKRISLPAQVIRHAKRTVYIPRMSDHAFALAAAFEYCGIGAEVLPESTKDAVELGKKFVSGKECYPCAVTTGDMVLKIREPGFVPSASAFFMPSGSGPCRFGQYNIFHRMVIRELGFEDIPVLAPNQDENFYEHLGGIGSNFAARAWEGITAIDLLSKCLHETRPYEAERGASDALYDEYLHKTYSSIKGVDGKIETLLKKAKADFSQVRRTDAPKPLVGIVGEIFVRSNRFSNENLIRKVEALGGEAYLAPIEEWISYINRMAFRKVLIKKEWSGMIKLLLKASFQKRTERILAGPFEGFLRNPHEPDTKALLTKASPYIHSSLEGEAVLSIGKSIDLINKGASGIINAMPFGCMPGTIVSGLMRGVAMDSGIPCLSIPFDGTESLTTEIQLEAFMDQAKEHHRGARPGDA